MKQDTMVNRYLTILEVSQKQAYIFQSNKLRTNMLNSAVIAWIMDEDYLEETAGDPRLFSKTENLVYSGGGHTVLEFPSRERADSFIRKITRTIREEYPGIDIFAKTIPYNEEKTPADNLKELTKALERKKAVRRSAFRQGSFGVEKIDTNTLKPVLDCGKEEPEMPEKEKKIDEELKPAGFENVFKFEDLGGSKNDKNFIAVVHIDGNAMGKRVEKLQRKFGDSDWETYKGKQNEFSKSIDDNFKAAYRGMAEKVADSIRKGNLADLELKGNCFPVRRVITAGDDICFVAEGRIGLECAAAFLDSLGGQNNSVDHEGYAACAGVAIVHQKYPFYRAYELAEMLCSNAKKSAAKYSADGSGSDVSMIDWHIEFGELKDTLEEIREEYRDRDAEADSDQDKRNNLISGRPYLVSAENADAIPSDQNKYQSLRDLIVKLQDDEDDEGGARGTLKELRSVLKRGRYEAEHFIRFHKIEDLLKWNFGDNSRQLFDAIELLDTFIALDDRRGKF